MRRRVRTLSGWLVPLLLAGCMAEDPGSSPALGGPGASRGEQALQVAREYYPRFEEISAGFIFKTCSPNPGVCHQTNNYPDLHTDANVASAVGAPCNVGIPDPLQGWDRCEQPGDVLQLGSFETTIGSLEQEGPGRWRLALQNQAAFTGVRSPVFRSEAGEVLFDPPAAWYVSVDLVKGSREATLQIAVEVGTLVELADSILRALRGGDPNRNGVFGASAAELGATIVPGDLDRSYLWGRVTGTVPGFRMPLANEPLSFPQYISLACWIEGLTLGSPGVKGAIDYDGCAFAAAPIDYTRE